MLEPAVYRRIQPQLLRLASIRCHECDFSSLGMRKSCSRCGSLAVLAFQSHPTGKLLYCTTTTKLGSTFCSQGARQLGLVELDDGPRICVAIAAPTPAQLRPGTRGKLVLRRLYEPARERMIAYGYKFLADQTESS